MTSRPARPPASARRMFASSVLASEALVVVLAALVAARLDLAPAAVAWGAGAALAVLCLLAAGLLRWPVGYVLGWVAQTALLVLSVRVPTMVILAVVFVLLWVGGLVLGTRVDRERAERGERERAVRLGS
ncbi:MAG: DUF4233 domain-containing protein [Actinomycetales bacterium]|nr:DUF4233 domain-containing protein [Actinomycetales bacterium]